MKKEQVKKTLAILMTLAMVLSLLPGIQLQASAKTPAITYGLAPNTTKTINLADIFVHPLHTWDYFCVVANPSTNQLLMHNDKTLTIYGSDPADGSEYGAFVGGTASEIKFTGAASGTYTYTICLFDYDIEFSTVETTDITFNIVGGNNAPTVSGLPTTITVKEDTESNVDLSAAAFSDAEGGSLTVTLTASAGAFTASPGGVVTVGGSGTGTLTLTGTAANITTYLDTATNITYTGALNASGDSAATITVNANDGTVNPVLGTINVNITTVNDEPTLTATGENPTYTENGSAVGLFRGVTAKTNDSGQTFSGLTLTVSNVTDSKEYLTVGGTDVELTDGKSGTISGGSSYSVAVASNTATVTVSGMTLTDTAMGTLIDGIAYKNTSKNPSTASRAIKITNITDSGASSNSASPNITTTVSVVAVNDKPSINAPASITATEDVATALTGISFADADAGSASVKATLSVPTGTLTATSADGVTILDSGTTSMTLTGTIADINAFLTASKVTFVPAPNATSNVALTIGIDDGGNTGSGGAQSASSTTTLIVTAINDEPSFTKGSDITVPEDCGAQSVAGWATAVSAGPSDESGQTLIFTASNDNNTLFSVQPAVASNGTLTFTPATNAYGTATVTVLVHDDGGTANSGDDTSASQTFTITITSVNDEPTVTNSTKTLDEDTTLTFAAADFTGHYSDTAEGSALSAVKIETLPDAGTGKLQLSGVDITASQVVNATDLGKITFVPASNFSGNATFTWKASDGTDYSAASATTTLIVTAINDAPTDISLSQSSILASNTGSNVVVGTLTSTDVDAGDTFTYTLITGSGGDNNASFNIDGSSLRTNNVLATGTYSVRIKTEDKAHEGFEKSLTIRVTDKAAIGLTAASASVDNDIAIVFTAGADAAFAAAITGVSVHGHALTSEQYTVDNDKITLHPSKNVNPYLRTPGTGNVVITATGYEDSSVSQTITAGAVSSLEVATQPVPGAETEKAFLTQPIVRLKDQFDNICTDGPSSATDITASAIAGTGTWTLGGTATKAATSGVVSFTDLTCTLLTSGNGKMKFAAGTKETFSNVFVIPERNSSINPTTAAFDLYTSASNYKDVVVTLTRNSNTLNGVKNGSNTLVLNTDYTLTGDTCTIKKEYLKNLSTGTANLTFDFNLGVDPVVAITVSNSTPTGGGSSGSGSGGSSGGGGGGGSSSAPTSTSTVVEVNGQKQDAGTTKTQTSAGQTVTTITVDDGKLTKVLESKGEKPTVTLPSNATSGVVVGELSGQTVKNMEKKEAVLEIKTGTVSYTLPASQINIDAVSSQLGTQVELKDIKVSVKIAEPSADTVKMVEDTAKKGSYQIVVKPVEFEISCTSGGKTVEVRQFNGYVERTVAIPDGVDPSKITTGIVLNSDGSFRHVPTTIVKIDGKYFAKINSRTNSTYSVIWNPVTFADVANHWAKDAVNDMGSRMVVTGISKSTYEPDRSITRAEFAAIVVRALGLAQGTEESNFGDVASTEWFNGYVDTATAYALITGYDSKTFAPKDTITREQAMAILARAMKTTGLKISLTDAEVSTLLAKYEDGNAVSDYAKASVAICLKSGVVAGSSATTISPKAYVTRAEVAVMVQHLLQKSGLI